ncbi:MAG: choice-of-anchor I family protein [Granulosicoccus sp.]|nr:choice-of-anchor I family protein [Granulosicoccus sp.]
MSHRAATRKPESLRALSALKKVVLLFACLAGNASAAITLNPIGGYDSGLIDQDAAEIVAHDPDSQRLFVVNGAISAIDVLDISDPTTPLQVGTIEVSPTLGAGANSVAVYNGVVAVAVESVPAQEPGKVAFFDASTLQLINHLQVGALPDMLTFTPDGTYLVVANEGEPDDDYLVDPEGSISIIGTRGGDIASLNQSDVKTASFTGPIKFINRNSVRVFGPGASVAQDLEPEYITIFQANTGSRHPRWKAMVTLQENNAMAQIDLYRARVDRVIGLGFKNHNEPQNAIDASNRDSRISINPWPVYGMYQPDAIASYVVDNRPYFVTANEGDARDYDGFSEEDRVGDLLLDSEKFPDAATLQLDENLGRLKITNTLGDFDQDGDFDGLFSYGGRSFSIYNRRGRQLFDSASMFEFVTASASPSRFNSQGTSDSFDSRSDDKGAEPEGVEIAVLDDRTYAFIGLERIGGIVIYDVTNPRAPFFVNYSNTSESLGDIAPEGLKFIPAGDSPNGKPLLVVGFEFSGTTRIFEIQQ